MVRGPPYCMLGLPAEGVYASRRRRGRRSHEAEELEKGYLTDVDFRSAAFPMFWIGCLVSWSFCRAAELTYSNLRFDWRVPCPHQRSSVRWRSPLQCAAPQSPQTRLLWSVSSWWSSAGANCPSADQHSMRSLTGYVCDTTSSSGGTQNLSEAEMLCSKNTLLLFKMLH